MRRVWWKWEAKPEVFEIWVLNGRHTGVPQTGWPGITVIEFTIWGNIITLTIGFVVQLYPRSERLEEIRENLESIQRDQ